MRARRITYVVISLLISAFLHAEVIEVRSQDDFNRLSETIREAANMGISDLEINITAGKLTFSDNQVSLKGIRNTQMRISIQGHGVKIQSQGKFVKKFSDPKYMYLNKDSYFNPWTDFYFATDTIIWSHESERYCRLRSSKKIKRKFHQQNLFIQYTCGYQSMICKLDRIDAWNLHFSNFDWMSKEPIDSRIINRDYSYGKVFPRYRLFGICACPKDLYECSASNLMQIEGCELGQLKVEGLQVLGSSSLAPLIVVNNSKADSIVFSECTFSCIGGTLLKINNSCNIHFHSNHVDTIMGSGIHAGYGCEGIQITQNHFSHCGIAFTNSFAIQMNGDLFLIADNVFTDFNYGGIGVGIWGGSQTQSKCRGKVTQNELYYTTAFFAHPEQHTLMDSGAIYVWTRTDGISICNNHIHDIIGMKDNRGIFCDDGTKNVTISNNRIERIANSYDIDLRWCDAYKNNVPDHNTGNILLKNETTGHIRFAGNR